LRHEIFLFSLQFSATLINLAQNGQIFYENQAHKVTCPKWANALRQLLDNQIDRGTVIDFHVSRTASPVATGGIWWAKPTQIMHQRPSN